MRRASRPSAGKEAKTVQEKVTHKLASSPPSLMLISCPAPSARICCSISRACSRHTASSVIMSGTESTAVTASSAVDTRSVDAATPTGSIVLDGVARDCIASKVTAAVAACLPRALPFCAGADAEALDDTAEDESCGEAASAVCATRPRSVPMWRCSAVLVASSSSASLANCARNHVGVGSSGCSGSAGGCQMQRTNIPKLSIDLNQIIHG